MNVLLVDDEVIELEALQVAINWKQLGITNLYTCINIIEAKQMLDSKNIHIMICDIEMPHGTGLELLEWMQTSHCDVVSILLTCHSEFTFATKAIRFGVFDYLLKPINAAEIEATLSKAIERSIKQNQTLSLEEETSSIKIVIQIINENIHSPLTREQIAGMVYLHPDYLSKLFKREMNIGLSDYITKVKVDEAKRLLSQSSMNIGTVATYLGYSNFSYFSRVFKKITGYTPGEYRDHLNGAN